MLAEEALLQLLLERCDGLSSSSGVGSSFQQRGAEMVKDLDSDSCLILIEQQGIACLVTLVVRREDIYKAVCTDETQSVCYFNGI